MKYYITAGTDSYGNTWILSRGQMKASQNWELREVDKFDSIESAKDAMVGLPVDGLTARLSISEITDEVLKGWF